MKIRSAVPENGCQVFLWRTEKTKKNKKKTKKNICKTYTLSPFIVILNGLKTFRSCSNHIYQRDSTVSTQYTTAAGNLLLTKLRGRRSSSTVLSQYCLDLPIMRRQSLGWPRIHDWRAREWSWLGSARLRYPKKDRRCPQYSVRQKRLSSARPNLFIEDKICPMNVDNFSIGTSCLARQSSSIALRSQTIPQIHRGILVECTHYVVRAWFLAR